MKIDNNIKEFNFFVSGCLAFLLSSCVSSASIYSLCEKDDHGNYVVKWEVSPDPQKGQVEIYSSTNDVTLRNSKSPSLVTNVEDRVATLRSSSKNVRDFFQLKANNSYSGIITNRHIEFDVIQNFRDLGGYFNDEDKQLRWGKLFRSGNLFAITRQDLQILKNLEIKTVVDLRNEKESRAFPDAFLGFLHFQIPIDTLNTFELQKKIATGTFLKGDALIYMQDSYLYILEQRTRELRQIFDILLDEKNYPILLHDILGKDRIGIISYLILKSLNVSTEDAINDYLLSNEYIDLDEYTKLMSEMPESIQEAMTVIVRADENYIDFAFGQIVKKYGSSDLYFEKALGLTPAKRQKLKKIMSY